MLPCNQDPIYDMFYFTVTQSQRVTHVVICYSTGIIVTAGVNIFLVAAAVI